MSNLPTTDTTHWAYDAVVYQIYPRSFADADGDGLGDIRGVISRVPYLRGLGIDAVWLSPFYPSALADGGYDVDDYRDVDPRLGTLTDLDDLIAALHDVGLKLIIDIVPNHTSDRHVWFQQALAAPAGHPARDRYVFRDGQGRDGAGPPSDWVSNFGGSAWTRVPDGQWYLHLFTPQQPDLNWDNPEVQAEFRDILRFWADRGVDGFRVDVAHALKKDLVAPLRSRPTPGDRATPTDGSDPLYDRDAVHEIYEDWRTVFDQYDPPRAAIAEAWVPAARRARYASPRGLGQAFNFDLLTADWDADVFRDVITLNLANAAEAGASSTWVLSNHDVVRHRSRYGLPNGTDLIAWLLTAGTNPPEDAALGLERARAATALILALPGSTYLYQGEELGLREAADLRAADLQDPIWLRSGHAEKGRDGCRVPLPWTRAGIAYGFSSTHAHLAQPDGFADLSVEAQDADRGSTLNLYRQILAARRRLDQTAALTWLDVAPGTVAFTRGDVTVVSNMSRAHVSLPVGQVIIATAPVTDSVPPGATVWVATGGAADATRAALRNNEGGLLS